MPDFVINLGHHEHKIQEKLQKINENQNNLKLFKTSSPTPLFWQSLENQLFFVLHTLS